MSEPVRDADGRSPQKVQQLSALPLVLSFLLSTQRISFPRNPPQNLQSFQHGRPGSATAHHHRLRTFVFLFFALVVVAGPPDLNQTNPTIFVQPYTAGGCPLFSNLEVPASSRSACTGACSPAPSSPAPVSRPPPTQQKPRSPTPSSYTLPSISSAGSSSGLNDASIWSTYLDYDLAPELDLSTQYYASPAAHPLPSLPPMGEPSTKHGILDIEEMFSAKKSRVDLYEQQAPEQQQRYATIEPSALSSEEENEADTVSCTSFFPTVSPRGWMSYSDERGSGAVRLSPSRSHLGARGSTAGSLNKLADSRSSTPNTGYSFHLQACLPPQPHRAPTVHPLESRRTSNRRSRFATSPLFSFAGVFADLGASRLTCKQGRTIVIAHTKPELLDILSKLFRHSTVASFIRQLNVSHGTYSTISTPLTTTTSHANPSPFPSDLLLQASDHDRPPLRHRRTPHVSLLLGSRLQRLRQPRLLPSFPRSPL